ncbi:hypothetical protein D6764_01660 [Candidatus Woesearchaeota archaeon]|nr:MAG: hypothetical protein D6764_01660 [Candidatus Woesearchaeota archaeon]
MADGFAEFAGVSEALKTPARSRQKRLGEGLAKRAGRNRWQMACRNKRAPAGARERAASREGADGKERTSPENQTRRKASIFRARPMAQPLWSDDYSQGVTRDLKELKKTELSKRTTDVLTKNWRATTGRQLNEKRKMKKETGKRGEKRKSEKRGAGIRNSQEIGSTQSVFYSAWITAAVLGILIATVSLAIVWQHALGEDFLEIYFETGRGNSELPQRASLYEPQSYAYSVAIANGETNPFLKNAAELLGRKSTEKHTIHSESRVEYYKMYDVTEGMHSCLTRNLPKLGMRWIEENETNRRIISRFERTLNAENYLPFVPVRTQTGGEGDAADAIHWKNYTVEYAMGAGYPTGWIIFRLEDADLTLVFDIKNKKTLVETGNETIQFENSILQDRTNHVRIVVQERRNEGESEEKGNEEKEKEQGNSPSSSRTTAREAVIVINSRELGRVPVRDYKESEDELGEGSNKEDGTSSAAAGNQLGENSERYPEKEHTDEITFKEIGTYGSIGGLKTYVNSKSILAEKNGIREYSIDQSLINVKAAELGKERTARITLTRVLLEGSIYDAFYQAVGSEKEAKINGSYLPSYWLVSNDNESQEINWTSFALSFTTEDFGGSGEAGVMFVEQDGTPAFGTALRRSTGDAFFFEYLNETRVRLVYDPNVKQYAKNSITLVKNTSNVKVILNDEELFNQNLTMEKHARAGTERFRHGFNLTFFAEKSITQFDRIKAVNLKPECRDALYFGSCEKEYTVLQQFRPVEARAGQRASIATAEKKTEAASKILEEAKKKALDRLTKIGEMNLNAPGKTGAGAGAGQAQENASEYELGNEFIRELIKNNATNYNPVIPDEKYEFTGPSARIDGWTNYEFKARFTPLDGSRIIAVSFHNESGDEVVKYVLSVLNDRAYLVRNGKTIEAERKMPDNSDQTLNILYEEGAAYFEHNYRPVFTLTGMNMSSGYFVVETYNSYFDIKSMEVVNRNTKERKIFRAERDPCQLRLVGIDITGIREFQLRAGEKKTFQENFMPKQDFDFGKVVVEARDENGNNASIHFWVTRE